MRMSLCFYYPRMTSVSYHCDLVRCWIEVVYNSLHRFSYDIFFDMVSFSDLFIANNEGQGQVLMPPQGLGYCWEVWRWKQIVGNIQFLLVFTTGVSFTKIKSPQGVVGIYCQSKFENDILKTANK